MEKDKAKEREAKVKDIRDRPEKHRHDYGQLMACCFHDGALDTGLMYEHERHASTGTNGGVRCDVTSGPCSCGAWH